jgi:hypothetical protein
MTKALPHHRPVLGLGQAVVVGMHPENLLSLASSSRQWHRRQPSQLSRHDVSSGNSTRRADKPSVIRRMLSPLPEPRMMALSGEARGRRKLFERSEFFRRPLKAGSLGVSTAAGRGFFGYFLHRVMEKVTSRRATPGQTPWPYEATADQRTYPRNRCSNPPYPPSLKGGTPRRFPPSAPFAKRGMKSSGQRSSRRRVSTSDAANPTPP